MFSRIKKLCKEWRRFRWLAYHDALTQCYNLHWLNDNRNKIEYSLVFFIDINDLKKHNESGHTNGDALIKEVADILKNNKNLSYVIRYGGDEFVALSSNKDYESVGLKTNTKFTVGYIARSGKDLWKEIHYADINMLVQKTLRGNKNEN